MDKIIVKNLKIFAYHGVNPEEKQNGQNFVFVSVGFAGIIRLVVFHTLLPPVHPFSFGLFRRTYAARAFSLHFLFRIDYMPPAATLYQFNINAR